MVIPESAMVQPTSPTILFTFDITTSILVLFIDSSSCFMSLKRRPKAVTKRRTGEGWSVFHRLSIAALTVHLKL